MDSLELRKIFHAVTNVLALVRFVATYQSRWENADIIRELDLLAQQALAGYLDEELPLIE